MPSALVVTTMIAIVVTLATAIPPSTRPVNIPPALPVECRRYDGTLVEGLVPGGTRDKGCEFCECDEDGQAMCAYADCMAPQCADPQKGECCSTCPNGKGSRLWVWIGARMNMHIIIAYTHKQVPTCTCTHTHTHTRTHAHKHTHARTQTHTHTENTMDETIISLSFISIL